VSSTSAKADLIEAGVAERLGLAPLRAKSLIVTVFGDSILPRGGACWLGELIELMAPLGQNERVVRTAVFRLVQDGVLDSERVGRRSRYTLTRTGRRQFDSAAARIYSANPPERDGGWTLVALPENVAAKDRDGLERDLGWLGFARLTAGLMGSARGDLSSTAQAAVSDAGLSDRCPVFKADTQNDLALARLAEHAWNLSELGSGYQEFVSRFAPLADQAAPIGKEAFSIRTLLIHTYRRALLRDPVLPPSLLPVPWSGDTARALAARLYISLAPTAETFLDGTLSEPADPDILSQRFSIS